PPYGVRSRPYGGRSQQGARTRVSQMPTRARCTVARRYGEPTSSAGGSRVADLLLLTPTAGGSAQVLPALGLLAHRVRVLPVEPSALLDAPDHDVLLLDARRDLATARSTCRLLRATGLTVPLVLILTEGGLTAVSAEWGAADVLLTDASPAEVEARLRLVIERAGDRRQDDVDQEISSGD